ADLYLEGSDQHRGWFQLSLLPALAATGEAPFKCVLTHGFIVGPDGKKVSKSDKNYVTATAEINRHGADLLRLFVCAADYEGDVSASPKLIADFGDKYRKIRNTLRYLLSNLYDYDGKGAAAPALSLDGWMLAELDTLVAEVKRAYEGYALHKAFRLLHDFCSVQISSVYGNAMKDRLYCDAPDSAARRQCQATMHALLLALTKMIAPMLVFTADETWEHIPHKPAADAGLSSVHLALWPAAATAATAPEAQAAYAALFETREMALAQLDRLKKESGVNKSVDAEARYPGKLRAALEPFGVDLEDLVGCGHHVFDDAIDELRIVDTRETYQACARSWKRRPDVGSDPDFPDLSARDAAAVKRLKDGASSAG
ncbi:MAG TPA: class I tRNA ligase family protein, partial [Tepidisphaeraceae bacterium]